MKNILFSFFLLLPINFIFASNRIGEWEQQNKQHFEASNTEEVIQLFNDWPSIFKEYNPNEYDTASLFITEYKWVGDSTCQPNDPRLFANQISFTLCYKSENGMIGACSMSGIRHLPMHDPCHNF